MHQYGHTLSTDIAKHMPIWAHTSTALPNTCPDRHTLAQSAKYSRKDSLQHRHGAKTHVFVHTLQHRYSRKRTPIQTQKQCQIACPHHQRQNTHLLIRQSQCTQQTDTHCDIKRKNQASTQGKHVEVCTSAPASSCGNEDHSQEHSTSTSVNWVLITNYCIILCI